MCFFCNKKTIFLYEFVFFLPKTNLWTKNYFCFYICDCVTRIGGHNTRSWQLAHLGDAAWQDVHRAKHNVCASFCDLFSPAICKSQDRWNHDARKLVWLWHCSQYLENSSPPRSKNGCPTVHPEWARNARRWLNKVRGHNRGKKTIFKAKKGKNAILAWGALIRRRLFSCTRFCAFHISFISHASCIHDKSITSNVNNISLLQFILSNQGIVNAVVYSCRHYISLLSDWWSMQRSKYEWQRSCSWAAANFFIKGFFYG